MKDELSETRTACEYQIELTKKNCSNVANVGFQKSIVESFKGPCYNKDVDVDSTWFLVGLSDAANDRKAGEFRNSVPEDYMPMSVGYDYLRVLAADETGLVEMIEQIHKNEDTERCLLNAIATRLEGKASERISAFNGEGGNCKGLFDEQLRVSVGVYAITVNSAVFFAQLVTHGPNPEIARLHKKRSVIVSEDSAGQRINDAEITHWFKHQLATTARVQDSATQMKHESIVNALRSPSVIKGHHS